MLRRVCFRKSCRWSALLGVERMRDLLRNRRKLWYATYLRDEPIRDDDGNLTAESQAVYTDPVAIYLNVSAASGEAAAAAFGAFTDYSRTISTADMKCPLNEGCWLWVDTDPESEDHDYEVVKKAKSLNGILYALREVTVS